MSTTSAGKTKTIGLWAAVAIGIGGMIGAGIFSTMGVAAGVSGTALPVSFAAGGLVTNAAGNMADPRRELPRALAVAVLAVIAIYVLVAVTFAGHLSPPAIEQARTSALAEAARSFLGEAGYRLIAVAALFATASAVNATLFGVANIGYQIAKDGQLPRAFTRQIWSRNVEGLFITSGLVIVFVLLFDLGPIAMMGSAAFLIVFAAVNAAHLRVRHETGAAPAVVWAALLACSAMFVLLMVYILRTQPAATPIALACALAGSLLAEWLYRRRTGRAISLSG